MKADIYADGIATRIEGPLLFLKRTVNVGLHEAVEVEDSEGKVRLGRISAIDDDNLTIEVLEATAGLGLDDTRVRFLGEPLTFAVGPEMLGRIFDGVGRVIDEGPPVPSDRVLRIDGLSINPAERERPTDFIETGISTIDIMNSLVRGQKLPIFSGAGLPHDELAIQIAHQAHLRKSSKQTEAANEFAMVFVAIGVPYDSAERFRSAMEASGALEHTLLFLNLASDSSTQRLLCPRYALTAAEYLAFEQGKHVLVVMTDMTNYCEALREVSASHGEVPSRKGFPGYMYSDLATLYERAGSIKGVAGSLTQLPILTMPSDDITHPIPDLTGYITEGQIVLDRELDRADIYPPVKVLPCLSRLMKDGTGEGFTHQDHPDLANQLYAAYARAIHVRVLASVVGREGLTETDRLFLDFGDSFEKQFIHQQGERSLEEGMTIGWQLLRRLPTSELFRLNDRQIAQYIEQDQEEVGA
ncbi:MAG: V-type ATP synthase subunit B [Gammaproteobacteria bacterium]